MFYIQPISVNSACQGFKFTLFCTGRLIWYLNLACCVTYSKILLSIIITMTNKKLYNTYNFRSLK